MALGTAHPSSHPGDSGGNRCVLRDAEPELSNTSMKRLSGCGIASNPVSRATEHEVDQPMAVARWADRLGALNVQNPSASPPDDGVQRSIAGGASGLLLADRLQLAELLVQLGLDFPPEAVA